MQSVYVFSSGNLKRHGNSLIVETENGKKHIPVENVLDLRIFGEISINKRLLEFLTQKGITVHFYNHKGYYVGTYYPRESNTTGTTFVKQVEHYINTFKRLKIAKEFVRGSMKNMIAFLKKYSKKGYKLSDIVDQLNKYLKSIDSAKTIPELMGYEGNSRDAYYSAFDKIIDRGEFKIQKRERRPPTNYMNTLISFGNSLIYTTTLSEIYKTHLDPRVGYLHEANQRRFTLHLDISEIFKPVIVDKTIFRLINRNQIKPKHFSKITGGLKLNEDGKKLFIKEFESKLSETIYHERLKRKISYRTLIRLEAYKLEKHILGMEEYTPWIYI